MLQVAASITESSEVRPAIYNLTDFLLKYLIPLTAVGAVSMAIIELVKKMLDTRTTFQARRWVNWMQRIAREDGSVAEHQRGSLCQLLQLCTGVSMDEAEAQAQALLQRRSVRGGLFGSPSPAHAVFALELERMMGSIQEAGDLALANPKRYESLYRVLTVGARPEDISGWFEGGGDAILHAASLPEDEQRQAVKHQSELFARLRQTVKGKLDGFQIYTSDRWTNWNQLAANVTGIIVMFLALLFSRWSERNVGFSFAALADSFAGSMIPISLFGGILSPVAKDLVTALQKVRNG
jgi:hypothetical protein